MSEALLAAPSRRLPDWVVFLAGWLRSPRRTGAIAPSGTALAARMADEVPRSGAGPVVELGPGTGALTQALAARVGEANLVLIERDPVFCRRLALRFPLARVIQGDATDLPRLLVEAGLGSASAVVSGLPLYSMSVPLRARLVDAALAATKGGPFVQFSYAPRFPVAGPWQVRRTALVWRNLPPAFVFVARP